MASLASHLVPWQRRRKAGLYWSSPSPCGSLWASPYGLGASPYGLGASPCGLSSRVGPLHTAAQPREPVLQETGLGPERDMVSFPLYSVG